MFAGRIDRRGARDTACIWRRSRPRRVVQAVGVDETLTQQRHNSRQPGRRAINLSWAVERQLKNIAKGRDATEKIALALRTARSIAERRCGALPDDRATRIGTHSGKSREKKQERG